MLMLCTRCKKNAAVVFVQKLDPSNGQQTTEGFCAQCARELNIGPVDSLLKQMGVSDEEFDKMNSEMQQFMSEMEDMDEEDFEALESEMDENTPIPTMGNLSNMLRSFLGKDSEGAAQDSASATTKTEKPKKKKKEKQRLLDSFGTNLTRKASEKLIDKVIGREKEIERVIQILNRRSKNNPVLLGEPGVGKTAVAEGLALRIAEKRVPPKLYGKEVYLLDFTAIVAGTQFRGQFEARLKKLLEEAKELGNIILVIDELHNIVGAGDAEGAMSAANILKPALARGDIQVLGATTLDEYRKHIEKDSALERRFQPVLVNEPSIADTVEILKGIREYYEKFHHVTISDEVAEQAVVMSERYITDRFLPDKAIDVIDEAGSKANLHNEALIRMTELKDELRKIQLEKENAVSGDSPEDYQKAAELKAKECALVEQINKMDSEGIDIALSVEDIASVIEDWTNIPVKSITEAESKKLLELESRLSERVIGQSQAIELVSQAIRRNRAHLTKERRPSSFIFVGPTGVGKTELAKTLAEVMFHNEEAMIRVDMSEYMEKHTVSKLIGAPPGYVGYDEAGQLTEKVRRKPYSIILLDEIEKAHPDVFNILLQILDDGRVADSHGRMVNFENTVIIMTSNAGSNGSSAAYGFNKTVESAVQSNAQAALKEIFRPEFLNRIDEVIVFNPLKQEELKEIVNLMLRELSAELFRKNMILEISEAAKDLVLEKGYDAKFGARPLRRTIEKYIQNPIAEAVIRGDVNKHSKIFIDAQNGEITMKIESITD